MKSISGEHEDIHFRVSVVSNRLFDRTDASLENIQHKFENGQYESESISSNKERITPHPAWSSTKRMNFTTFIAIQEYFFFVFYSMQIVTMSKSKRCRSSSPSSVRSSKKSKEVLSEEITNILDLNDDCFEAVFSHLDPIDLCAVKETFHRFDPLADDAFRQKYRGKILKFNPLNRENVIRSLNTDIYMRKSYVSPKHLRLFGKFIYRLSVGDLSSERDSQQWQNICENCTQLKSLTLSRCDLQHFTYPANAEPCQLDFLDLSECYGNDEHFTQILTYFGNIKRLLIENAYWKPKAELRFTFLHRNFEQLKEVTFQSCGVNQIFDNFIRI